MKKKNKPTEKVADQWKWIDDRVKELYPIITNRSHYFRVLADIDQKQGMIVSMKNVGAKRRR